MAEDADDGREAPPSQVIAPADTAERVSTSEAGRILASLRHKREPEQTPQEEAPAQEESAAPETGAEDAAPPQEEAPGETQEADPVEEPSIEPPRSWTKEAKERWQSLPRETQEYLAEREQERERELRRGQNEAAEKLKGLTAKEQAVEQARQQYESALPLLFQNLQSVQNAEFADIQSMVDVQKLAAEDWPRYIRWDAHQKQMNAIQQALQVTEQRRSQEHAQEWTEFAKKQDDKFLEIAPEMADPDKAAKIQKAAISYAKDIGFTEQELFDSYHGKLGFAARDYRFQALLKDAMSWREAQKSSKEVVKKPVPPVQRPGISQPRGAAQEAEVQALAKRIDNTSGINQLRAAADALIARRKAAARR